MTTKYDSENELQRPENSILSKRGGAAWWITTTSQNGKFVVLGPYASEEIASEYGFTKLGNNFDCKWLPTRDMSRATHILKKERFDSIHNLDEALARARHKVT